MNELELRANPDSAKLAERFGRVIAEETDLFLAFYKARALGVILYSNNLGLYALPEVEQQLFDRMQARLAPVSMADSELPQAELGFVITTGYLTGGHTRLMERLARFCSASADLLVTGSCTPAVLDHWHSQFAQISCLNQFSPQAFPEQVLRLAQQLARYAQLVIFIHPEDVIAVVALRLAKQWRPDLRIYYVNHADHTFSYGVSVADYWFELSAFGQELDKHRPGLTAQRSFLGIPVESVQLPSAHQELRIRHIVTAGNGAKFKPVAGQSLMPLLDALLQRYPDAVVQAVGVNCRDSWWWPLKWRYRDRVRLYAKLPYARYLELTRTADLYLDSHPFPGGTAFVEQYLQGRYCAGLISPWRGYTPLELLKVASPAELLSSLENGPIEMTSINRLIQEVNGLESVRLRFLDCLHRQICHPNPMSALVPPVDIHWDRRAFPKVVEFSRIAPLGIWQGLKLLRKLGFPLWIYGVALRDLVLMNGRKIRSVLQQAKKI